MPRFLITMVTLLMLATLSTLVGCGENYGQKIAQNEVHLYHTEVVDLDTARTVLDSLIRQKFDFGYPVRPVQVDRKDGRMVIRMVYGDEQTIAAIEKNGRSERAVEHLTALAYHTATDLRGREQIDVILCRPGMEPYYIIAWDDVAAYLQLYQSKSF